MTITKYGLEGGTEEEAVAFLVAQGISPDQAAEFVELACRNAGRTFTRWNWMVALELEPPQDGFWVTKWES